MRILEIDKGNFEVDFEYVPEVNSQESAVALGAVFRHWRARVSNAPTYKAGQVISDLFAEGTGGFEKLLYDYCSDPKRGGELREGVVPMSAAGLTLLYDILYEFAETTHEDVMGSDASAASRIAGGGVAGLMLEAVQAQAPECAVRQHSEKPTFGFAQALNAS